MNRNWILYDYLRVNGGAERVACDFIKSNCTYKLLVSTIYDNFKFPSGIDESRVNYLFKNKRFITNFLTYYFFSHKNISQIKNATNVIYSGVYSILAEGNQKSGKKIYYCHTPPRFIYDRIDEYLKRYDVFSRQILKQFLKTYKKRYEKSLGSMKLILTNSNHMRKYIKKTLNRDSSVVYPAIDKNFKWISQSDYYVSLGRLEPNKRVETVIKAFLKMPNKKLIVTSGGSQFIYLNKTYGHYENITFTNWVSDIKLREIIGNATACIYIPQDEDLGISALESQRAGKPIISVNEGGQPEIIKHDITGYLLEPNPSPDSVVDAINYINIEKALKMRTNCEEYASQFTDSRFSDKIFEYMDNYC
jgi:glycosyltransferase involved in cell wall biosynthesis